MCIFHHLNKQCTIIAVHQYSPCGGVAVLVAVDVLTVDNMDSSDWVVDTDGSVLDTDECVADDIPGNVVIEDDDLSVLSDDMPPTTCIAGQNNYCV